MRKFKILLFVFLFPITFILYYLSSEKYGISAYIEKKKELDQISKRNLILQNKIDLLTNRIKLLDTESPDIDLIKEKAIETLGISDKQELVINIENL